MGWEELYTRVGLEMIHRFLRLEHRIPSGDWDGMYLFAGPHRVLRCFEDATSNHLPMEHLDDDGPYTKFITRSLCEITDEREVVEPIGYVGIILDEINGLHDRCTTTGSFIPLYAVSEPSGQAAVVVVMATGAFSNPGRCRCSLAYTTKPASLLLHGVKKIRS